MSDKPEPLDAILAEMRAAAKSTDLFNGEEVGEPLIRGTKVEDLADRIEAAAERMRDAYCELCKEKDEAYDRLLFERDRAIQSAAPGNAAAMREALKESTAILAVVRGDEYEENITRQIDRNTDALAAPPRNCDVGDAAEQSERLAKFCKANFEKAKKDKHICGECRFNDCIGECTLKWAQLPFTPEKGGAE